MAQTYLLEIDFRLQPEKRREFNSSAYNLRDCEGSGQVRSLTYEDRDDHDHLLLVNEWSDRGAMEAYLTSEPYRALLGCLRTLGAVSDCRIVELTVPAGTTGAGLTARWVRGRSE